LRHEITFEDSSRNNSAQRPGIYEVWALKNVRPATELVLKTDLLD